MLSNDKEQEKKFLLGPFNKKNNVVDSVNMNTGALLYEDNILNIPGRNGLDLNLTYKYDSGKRHFGHNDDTSHVGMSWFINVPSIYGERRNNSLPPRYLRMPDGSEYKLGGNRPYVIQGYPFNDAELKEDLNNSFANDAKYVLTYHTGIKQYFDYRG